MAPPSSFDFVVNRILPLIFCRFSRCFCRWKIIVVDIGTSGEGMDVSLVYSKFVSSRDESFISSGGKEFKLISHRSIVRKNYNCRMIVMILPSRSFLKFAVIQWTCRGWLNHLANIHFSFDQEDILKDSYIRWFCNYCKISKLSFILLNILLMQKLHNFFFAITWNWIVE